MRPRTCIRVLATGIGVLACLGLAASPSEPVLVTGVGVWSLQRLGYDATTFANVERMAHADVAYRLPSGARQGPRTWYLVQVHIRLRLSGGDGTIQFSALHNGAASAQIRFTGRETPDGTYEIERGSTDLVDGTVRTVVRSRIVEVRYQNFLPYAAVREGLNTLRFQVERQGSVQLDALTILPSSGLAVSRAGPARISIAAVGRPRTVRVGKAFTIRVLISNVGERPTRYSRVALEFARDEIRATSSQAATGAIPARGSVKKRFVLRALRAGNLVIAVTATSSSNRPAISFVVRATRD